MHDSSDGPFVYVGPGMDGPFVYVGPGMDGPFVYVGPGMDYNVISCDVLFGTDMWLLCIVP